MSVYKRWAWKWFMFWLKWNEQLHMLLCLPWFQSPWFLRMSSPLMFTWSRLLWYLHVLGEELYLQYSSQLLPILPFWSYSMAAAVACKCANVSLRFFWKHNVFGYSFSCNSVLVSFFFSSYKLNLFGIKEFHLRNCFHQIGLYTRLCGHFFYGSVTHGQVLLSYIRKQAE